MPCPGIRECRVDCLHRGFVEEFWDAGFARDALREQGDNMRLEDDEFDARHPPLRFKDWLISNTGWSKHANGTQGQGDSRAEDDCGEPQAGSEQRRCTG